MEKSKFHDVALEHIIPNTDQKFVIKKVDCEKLKCSSIGPDPGKHKKTVVNFFRFMMQTTPQLEKWSGF